MAEYPTGTDLADHLPGVSTAELVQSGGQKAIYRATINGKIVALKVIAPDPSDVADEETGADASAVVERAQREVAILEQVDVPVLARRGPLGLSTIDIDGKRWLFFTEEWIEGSCLRDMIDESRFPPDQVARLGIDLIQASCWLSQRGLVHRDIKPANVMWADDRSKFVLLDPGIALDLYGPSLTHVPMVVGTMAYLSPEQMDLYQKRNLDFRSDLFAIGIVMYEAAVAEHPFMTIRTTPSEVLGGIMTMSPQSVADRVGDFPSTLSSFISRLLAKAPHLRYRTCGRAQAAIEEIAALLGVQI